MLRNKAKTKIIKFGKEGCLYYSKDKQFPVHSQVIDNVVDKTGAGDCLNGVFLNLLVNGESEESAFRTAVDISTESINQHGILGLRLPNQNQERVV